MQRVLKRTTYFSARIDVDLAPAAKSEHSNEMQDSTHAVTIKLENQWRNTESATGPMSECMTLYHAVYPGMPIEVS